MSRTLLLLGADGFAGRHLRRAAEGHDFRVVAATRRGGERRVDLLEPSTIRAALAEIGPDVVVNLAGSASVGASFAAPAATFEVNALGSLNLLDAVAATRPGAYVLSVSSGEVYGAPGGGDLPFTEERPLHPESPYAASKAAMEIMCRQYERREGIRVGIARAFNHTGPGQAAAFAASSFACQVAAAEQEGRDEVTIEVGNLDVARDFSDVRDVVDCYLRFCDQELTGTFNVCSGVAVPIRRILEQLDALTELRVTQNVDPDRVREGEPAELYGSNERVRAVTGWAPRIPLSRTVADLLDHWRERRRDGAGLPPVPSTRG